MTNLGREIVGNILTSRTPALKKFLDAGFDMDWLNNPTDLSRAAIFSNTDLDAYKFIVRRFITSRAVPSIGYFRYSFPVETYRLPVGSSMTTDELLAMATEDRLRCQLEVYGGEFIDLVESGQYAEAHDVLQEAARIRTDRQSNVTLVWDSDDYDVKSRINREVKQGVVTGIPELDADFGGWQPGDLVTYLGRPKAGKTSFFLLSALANYLNEEIKRRIMFVSVEVAAGDDPDRPGIADRLDAFNAGIDYQDYARGRLNDNGRAAEKLLASREQMDNPGEFIIIQPVGTYSIIDLENDIESFEPDVVYIDGFYLMTDAVSGKSGGNWEGHDNLAKAMKFLAMRRKIVLVTSMQVRGKQLSGKKKEIDNDAMMGGTGLIMWSTMVLGINIDEEHAVHTINCTASRVGYLPTVRGTWDWKQCRFTVNNNTYEPDEFGGGI